LLGRSVPRRAPLWWPYANSTLNFGERGGRNAIFGRGLFFCSCHWLSFVPWRGCVETVRGPADTLHEAKLGSEWQPARCSCTPLIARGLFFRRTRYQRILKFLISLPRFRSIPPIPPRTPPSICFIVPRKPLYIRTAHRNASEPLKMRRHLPDQKRRPAGGAPPAPSGPPGMGLPCSCCRAARLQSLPQAKSASAGGRPPSN
jgi:hypothetical protein